MNISKRRTLFVAAMTLIALMTFVGPAALQAYATDFLVWGQGTPSTPANYLPGVVIGVGSTINGNVGSRGDIRFGGGVTLNGDVDTASQFSHGRGVTINGTITENNALVQQALPAPAVIPVGTQPVPALGNGGSFTFVPGVAYQAVSGGGGCSLYFTSGTYSFDSLAFANGATLYMDLTGGPIRILVSGRARFGADLDTVITSAVGDASDISLESHWAGVSGTPYSFTAGGGSDWLGSVFCPYGGIHFGSGGSPSTFQGYFWSAWNGYVGGSRQQAVYIEHGVVGTKPPEPGPLPVLVSKTVSTTIEREWRWTIDKSVAPATWDLFKGDTGESRYTVTVDKTGSVNSYVVTGTITVSNMSGEDVSVTSVADVMTGPRNATITSGPSLPHLLQAGGTAAFGYEATLPDASSGTNTATVVFSSVGGSWTVEDSQPVDFTGASTVDVNDTIHVDDTNGGTWQFSDDGAVQYAKTFTCSVDRGIHHNTATIRETGQSDDASVTVNCYSLAVTKNASTELTRTYTWEIDKSADHSTLTLTTGQMHSVEYTVQVDIDSWSDSDWKAVGTVRIHNPAPMAATINSVTDVVSPDIAATLIDAPTSWPHTLAAGGDLYIHYGVDLPNGNTRTNTATATLQNRKYLLSGTTLGGTTGFSGSASVGFAGATIHKVDECITVSDTYAGSLGDVCFEAGTLPRIFTYSRWIGPYATCGTYRVDNTASFITNDTGTAGSDAWTITVNIPCEGRTLTPGYWKTHSKYGPAPYDDAWACIGEDAVFYKSGKTWYQVLWTSPSGGNAYYILSYQYIAAKLNICNGASYPPEVAVAIAWAETFFNTYKPTDKLNRRLRNQAIYYAGVLADYNEGVIGPGHADE